MTVPEAVPVVGQVNVVPVWFIKVRVMYPAVVEACDDKVSRPK